MSESVDSLMPLDLSKTRIPYKYRNIDITVSCPYYAPVNGVVFSHTLEGFDKMWEDSDSSPYIKYRHLSPGKYILKVKAATESGHILDHLNYEFQILKPFYLSFIALILYALIGAAAVFFIVVTFKDRMAKNMLEEEVRDKSKELASSTLTLIRKNESLIQIRHEIEKTIKKYEGEYPDMNLVPIIKLIDSHLSTDSDWELFRKNFDRIHENFFRNLRKKYPELTSTDLKFCAYLRLNLSSKDIASLMNISLKGVEAARYRIRKKINLPSESSLTGYFIGFKE